MIDYKKLILSENGSILDSMKVIDSTVCKLCLVVDGNGKLIGTVTDGDIRRGFLSGHDTKEKVSVIMRKTPSYALEGTPKADIVKMMKLKKISSIPVVDKNKVVVGIEYSSDIYTTEEKKNHVVLMAGGLGSRLGDLTRQCPKPMLKVGDKPILENIIENFRDHGFKYFYISVNYKSETIEEYFKDGKNWSVEIKYLKETTKLGTAGSLSLYQDHNDLPMIVMNGDLLTNINFSKLLELHEQNQNHATMGVRQYDHQVPYGVIVVEGDKVTKIEEKPVYSYFVSGGVYVIDPKVLKHIPDGVFYDMPTFFQDLINKKYKVGHYPINEYWLDIGRKDDFDKAHADVHDAVLVDKFRE